MCVCVLISNLCKFHNAVVKLFYVNANRQREKGTHINFKRLKKKFEIVIYLFRKKSQQTPLYVFSVGILFRCFAV